MDEIDRVIDVDVEGMSCGHCVQHVTEALQNLSPVKNVAVTLKPGEASEVKVVTDTEIADEDIKAAIDEAGYDVVGIRRDF
ncbi:MAG: cation transporter [Varibaculum sp.]|nr:cation transporter [Varibaculum sp.]